MSAHPEEIAFRSWRVRPQLREIEGPAGTVRVKPKSMDVFLALLRRPRQLRSKDELLAEILPGSPASSEPGSICNAFRWATGRFGSRAVATT